MTLNLALFLGGLLAVVATLSTQLARRFGVPSLLLFVALGMLAGSSGPGGIVFANYDLARNLGFVALAVILFSGGLDTHYAHVRAAALPASLLSTLGVAVTAGVVGLGVWWLTPLDLLPSLVLGTVLAPTDAAAVFSVLRGRGVPGRLSALLEVESGTNDPVAIHLTLLLTAAATSGGGTLWLTGVGIVAQLLVGLAVGWVGARILAWAINATRLESFGLFPVLALAGALAIFGATELASGNGFLAVYVVGLVLGNRRLVHRSGIRTFMDSAAWTGQIMMFVVLGLLVFPDQLWPWIPSGLMVAALLALVARPLAVFALLLPLRRLGRRYRFRARELALVSWAGLKGAVPVILATIPLLQGMAGGQALFNLVFVVVIASAAVQGPTIVPLARWLGLVRSLPPPPPLRLELGGEAPAGSAVLDVFLYGDEPAVGRTLREVNVPPGLVVAAIYRGGRMVTPRGDVTFEPSDHVYLITDDADRVRLPPDFKRRRRDARAAARA